MQSRVWEYRIYYNCLEFWALVLVIRAYNLKRQEHGNCKFILHVGLGVGEPSSERSRAEKCS